MKDKSKNKEIIKVNQAKVVTKKQKMIAFVYRIWNRIKEDDLILRAFVKKKCQTGFLTTNMEYLVE